MLRTGVDLVEIERIRKSIQRHGVRFLNRVYTVDELSYCQGRVESLAARFAAKEATSKALGTGIWRNGIGWTDIEVGRDPKSGAPHLLLHNKGNCLPAIMANADGPLMEVQQFSLFHSSVVE